MLKAFSQVGCFYFEDLVDLPDTFAYKLREYMSTWYKSKSFGKVIKDD